MKKLLILVIIAVFVMIPIASFAQTAMSDSELATVTGKAGVSINFDSIIGGNISSITWGSNISSRGCGTFLKRLPKIITFFKHQHTRGIYVPSNAGVLTITAH